MDNEQNSNSNRFFLYTEQELEQQKYIEEIQNITTKYNILENENYLISSSQKSFLHLINFAVSLYKKNEVLPKDIENIFLNNIFLKEQINTFLDKKLINLTTNDSSHFIDNLEILIYICSIGINKNILDTNYNYDFNAISDIFRFYEKQLKELSYKNKELFLITFDSYLILLKTFIQLCKINSLDLMKKKDISNIIELMTETINIIKFSISLNENELNKLNNLSGKFLYYFSHLQEIEIDIINLDISLQKYLLLLEKQEDGFLLSINKDFENQNSISKEDEFILFKSYSSILLLKLIKDLENCFDTKDYFYNEYFQKIIKTYHKRFSLNQETKIPPNIEDFRNRLLSSLLLDYKSNLDFSKKLDYHYVIEDFIFSGNDFDNRNLETVYRILSFAKDIEDFKYKHIIEILVNSTKINNDFYEFYKLAIFDLYINKFKNQTNDSYNNLYFDKISNYLKNNHFTFTLSSIYLKIYAFLENINTEYKDFSLTNKNENKKNIKYSLTDDENDILY